MFARMKTLSMVLCLVVICLTLSATAMASDSDKKTIITTNQPLEIPGKVVLPAGKYVMKLVDLPGSRNVVQFFNADETKLYAMVMGIPDYRLETPDKPEISLSETEKGTPYAIREWFYPGSNYGIEFPTSSLAGDHASTYASDSAIKSFDDQIRWAASRAIYRDPMFTAYAIQANPPIHIIVENGKVTLKGMVATPMEKQLAEMKVRTGVMAFEVNNDLQVERLG